MRSCPWGQTYSARGRSSTTVQLDRLERFLPVPAGGIPNGIELGDDSVPHSLAFVVRTTGPKRELPAHFEAKERHVLRQDKSVGLAGV